MNTLVIETSYYRLQYRGACICCCEGDVIDRGPILPEGLPVNVLQKLIHKQCKPSNSEADQKQLYLKYKNIGKNSGKKSKFVAILVKVLNENDDIELGEFYLAIRIIKKLKFEGKELRGYTSKDLCYISDLYEVDTNEFLALCTLELEL